MTRHGMDYYFLIKYYMENLIRGVFPMWDPFLFWGKADDLDMRFIGEFNPFLWLYPLFLKLGFAPPQSFIFYAISYFFIGLIGFYLLAKRIFKDRLLACCAFVLFLFSSEVAPIFNNFCIALLVVPAVWFFYFLVAFAQEPDQKFFLGLVFSVMILAITYMPFYWLTVLIFFLISFIVLYPKETKTILGRWMNFIVRNKLIVLFGVLAIGLAMIPGILWYCSAQRGDFVFSWRHAGAEDPNAASVNIETINAGGIIAPYIFKSLFSHLDQADLFFYIPGVCFVILALAVLNRLNRVSIILFVVGFIIFLITLADLTPVHRLLYQSVYFFRLFRNIFYFLYMAIPVFILFCVEQLRLLFNNQPIDTKTKIYKLGGIFLLHLGFLWFLYRQEDIIPSFYITVGLSFIFFASYYLGWIKRERPVFAATLIILLVLSPVDVFRSCLKNGFSIVDWKPKDRFYPRFSFLRPFKKDEGDFYKGKSPQDVQDASGFASWKYSGYPASYLLHEHINHDILETYVRHKFVVYDNAQTRDGQQFDFKVMEKVFAQRKNIAFVFPDPLRPIASSSASSLDSISGEPLFVEGNSSEFQLDVFDINRVQVKTMFPVQKFLVYNDNYDPAWQVFVNGRREEILRANLAFKGIWLKPGKNVVEFRYGSWPRHFVNFFLLFFFNGFFLYLVGRWILFYRGNTGIKDVQMKTA